jgi:hypothetical protein
LPDGVAPYTSTALAPAFASAAGTAAANAAPTVSAKADVVSPDSLPVVESNNVERLTRSLESLKKRFYEDIRALLVSDAFATCFIC